MGGGDWKSSSSPSSGIMAGSTQWPSRRMVCSWLRASADGTVRIWETQTGKELLVLNGNKSSVSTLAFSPDGTRLAAGGVGTRLAHRRISGRHGQNLGGCHRQGTLRPRGKQAALLPPWRFPRMGRAWRREGGSSKSGKRRRGANFLPRLGTTRQFPLLRFRRTDDAWLRPASTTPSESGRRPRARTSSPSLHNGSLLSLSRPTASVWPRRATMAPSMSGRQPNRPRRRPDHKEGNLYAM